MEYPPTIRVGPENADGHMFTLRTTVGEMIPNKAFYEYLKEKTSPEGFRCFQQRDEAYRALHLNRNYIEKEYNTAGRELARTIKKCLPDATVTFCPFSSDEETKEEEIQ